MEDDEESAPPLVGSARYRVADFNIGQGAYGKVEKAEDKLTGEFVAIKKVKLSINDVPLQEAGMIRNNGINITVFREIKIMRELDHENVITLKDCYVEGDFINLVMPLMASDLRKILDKRVRLNESQVKCIMQQIIKGVCVLHAHWFLHRDLAPANVFINDRGICKVADFGLARSYGSPRPSRKTYQVVTLWYRSPELLYGAQYYQDKVDVWSIGCILAELLMGGRALFPGTNELDQLAKIFAVLGSPTIVDPEDLAAGKSLPDDARWPEAANLPMFCEFSHAPAQRWSDILPLAPAPALDLMDKLLQLDPNKRISCQEALKHAWFSTPPLACSPDMLQPVI